MFSALIREGEERGNNRVTLPFDFDKLKYYHRNTVDVCNGKKDYVKDQQYKNVVKDDEK